MSTPWKRTTVIGLVGGTALVAFAGNAAAVVPSEQSLHDVPNTVEKGTRVTLSGTLTGLRDRPVSGEQVALERRAADGRWQAVDTTTTGDDGNATFHRTPDRTAEWRLTYDGSTFLDPAASSPQRVEVRLPPPPPPAPERPTKPIGRQLVDVAAAQAGKPYAYGAAGPQRFDCSGFAQFVHGQVGIRLPRTSSEQHRAVRAVANHAKVPGDLVFFHEGGSVYHVGIYAGGNHVWAAPESGDVIRKQRIWTDAYYTGRAW
ncbi:MULTISPECIES: C40 family peptidase [Prauserella salsuginis group]|uniref:Cell wall-associated NlpC family hydrolase n=2 Tax=Prauserella salsuginis group TaxID=2893672 RepID=A0A839XUS2_9PSEU|nr:MULTISPECIES: C40 family peptidase [Prauserella salsuginis group]MBB3664303.1 cell wall-associated NlpC family hydrolase [Prauserella sediminis]MCR3721747.1 Cell wall-associated hydrolase, NlpC family [Prauserella flava]MCR3734438.1 Cell wall-associated hydrolase, NlpC family [Prauserella salsuginis]